MTKRPRSRPPEPQNASETDASLIDEALAEVLGRVPRIGNVARAREFAARARTYQTAVRAWPAFPPNDAQRDALMELAMELRDRARHETQTLPPPHESLPEPEKPRTSVLGALRRRSSRAPAK